MDKLFLVLTQTIEALRNKTIKRLDMELGAKLRTFTTNCANYLNFTNKIVTQEKISLIE